MENQTTTQSEQPPQPAPSSKKPGYYMSKLQWTFFGIAFGGIIGFLIATHSTELMADITPTLITIGLTLTLVLILLIVVLPNLINYYIKRYTKQDVDVETLVGDLQSKTTDISVALSDAILVNADPKIKANIQADLPKVLYYFVFSRLRNTGLRFLMTIFAAIAGLMGTILLYNQNQLLQKQNEKIDRQILLDEASRRSSLNFLMANVLDKIDEELKTAEKTGKPRRLSQELIGRIASLSQSFQPYRFMDGDDMIGKPYSPERGNLLLALINSDLDTSTLEKIYEQAIFFDAYLKEAILDTVNLSGAKLNGADLSGASLSGANLSGANLLGANLSGARLGQANLSGANLWEATLWGATFWISDLSGADLSGADLSGASLIRTNLDGARLARADITGVNFSGASLNKATLWGANLSKTFGITEEMLRSCKSIYEVRGLPDSLTVNLRSEIDKKPDGWK